MEKRIYEYCDGNRFEVVLPSGFHWVEGEVDTGCVIENETGDQYVRIPLGYTAEGLFVRGFWVSRYEISKGESGEPKSIAGAEPWVDINYNEAELISENSNASLLTKEEYDRISIWLLLTKAVDIDKLFVDGAGLGNFSDPFQITKTGSNKDWMINNIDSFWGNTYTWTSERSELYEHHIVIRGGHSSYGGLKDTPICRKRVSPDLKRNDISFRMVIRDQRLNDD